MKNRMTSFMLSVSAAAVLTACTVEDPRQDGQANLITVTASILTEDDTKVTYTDNGTTLHPSWTVGDYLIACDDKSNTYGYIVESLDSQKDAVLKLVTAGEHAGSKTKDPDKGTKMYFAYVPGKTPSAISDGKVEVDISSQQPGDAMPAIMTASGTVQDGKLALHFRNKCSVIGIKDILIEYAGSKKFTKLTLSSHEIVSEATLNLKEDTLTGKDPSKFITSSISATAGADGRLSGAYFIAMIPCTTRSIYPIVLTATDTDGNTYSKKLNSKDKTWTAGKYYYLHGKSTATLTKNNDLPTVAMTVGSVQWADRNLGADSPTDAGTYYMWGSVEKIYSSIEGDKVMNITSPATGFDLKSAPFSKGDGTYSKYNSTDGKFTLEPFDDIVQLTWPGSGWQMPSKDDFDALNSSCTWTWDPDKKCRYSGSLYFRAAGYLDTTARVNYDLDINVWTSTRAEDHALSYTWHGDYFSMQTESFQRRYGYPIRPVKK